MPPNFDAMNDKKIDFFFDYIQFCIQKSIRFTLYTLRYTVNVFSYIHNLLYILILHLKIKKGKIFRGLRFFALIYIYKKYIFLTKSRLQFKREDKTGPIVIQFNNN